jgi:hypothetical protein
MFNRKKEREVIMDSKETMGTHLMEKVLPDSSQTVLGMAEIAGCYVVITEEYGTKKAIIANGNEVTSVGLRNPDSW